jgi:hypothetical protein
MASGRTQPLLLQSATDDLLQLGHLGTNRVKERKHDADLLCRKHRVDRAEAEGYQGGLGLAQEVPDSSCLTNPGCLELLQPLLSNGQLLHLPLDQPLLPFCQLRHPIVQVSLLDVRSKLMSSHLEAGIL